jgi:hypothetical protein
MVWVGWRLCRGSYRIIINCWYFRKSDMLQCVLSSIASSLGPFPDFQHCTFPFFSDKLGMKVPFSIIIIMNISENLGGKNRVGNSSIL